MIRWVWAEPQTSLLIKKQPEWFSEAAMFHNHWLSSSISRNGKILSLTYVIFWHWASLLHQSFVFPIFMENINVYQLLLGPENRDSIMSCEGHIRWKARLQGCCLESISAVLFSGKNKILSKFLKIPNWNFNKNLKKKFLNNPLEKVK